VLCWGGALVAAVKRFQSRFKLPRGGCIGFFLTQKTDLAGSTRGEYATSLRLGKLSHVRPWCFAFWDFVYEAPLSLPPPPFPGGEAT
jgi:hypothetical protein